MPQLAPAPADRLTEGAILVSLALTGVLIASQISSQALLVALAATGALLITWLTPIRFPADMVVSSRSKVLFPAAVAVSGVVLPMLVLALLYHGVLEIFRERMEPTLLAIGIVSAAGVLGGIARGWHRLGEHDRAFVILAAQWMVWPLLLPLVGYLALLLLDVHPLKAWYLTDRSLVLPIGAVIVGALSISRFWALQLHGSVLALLVYWAALTCWVYFWRVLG